MTDETAETAGTANYPQAHYIVGFLVEHRGHDIEARLLEGNRVTLECAACFTYQNCPSDEVKAKEENAALRERVEELERHLDLALPKAAKACVVEAELREQLTAKGARIAELEHSKNAAYSERNKLVAFLAEQFESHVCRHPDEDATWEDAWRWIVCIHLPTGQATWHIHDSEFHAFAHLPHGHAHWDGHSTDEKYARLHEARGWLEREAAAMGEALSYVLREWVDPADLDEVTEQVNELKPKGASLNGI